LIRIYNILHEHKIDTFQVTREAYNINYEFVHQLRANKLDKEEQKGSTKTNPFSLSTSWSEYFNATVPSIDPAA
jgi:hypothetical protein